MQLISKKAVDMKTLGKEVKSLNFVIFTGFFLAMYFVLYLCNIIITPVIQFRLGFLAIAVAGLYGGPLMGLTVGAGGDLLAFFLTGGQGASFFGGFTISYALMGFLFGLIFYGTKVNIIRSIMGALVEFCISIFLNTYWLSILYGTSYTALFITRIPKALIMIVISTILLSLVLQSLQAILKRASFLKE